MSIRARLSVSTAETVGITQVPHYQCADAVRVGELRIILAEFELEPLPVHLIHAGVLPSKMRFFLDFTADRLRTGLAALQGE